MITTVEVFRLKSDKEIYENQEVVKTPIIRKRMLNFLGNMIGMDPNRLNKRIFDKF